MSDGNYMGIFDSLETQNSALNDLNNKMDTVKLYDMVSMIISSVSLILVIGLYVYMREK